MRKSFVVLMVIWLHSLPANTQFRVFWWVESFLSGLYFIDRDRGCIGTVIGKFSTCRLSLLSVHNYLEHMPSGRIRTHRVWATIGKECIYGLFIENVNKTVFYHLHSIIIYLYTYSFYSNHKKSFRRCRMYCLLYLYDNALINLSINQSL